MLPSATLLAFRQARNREVSQMNLTIDLTHDEERRVENARARGIDVESMIRDLLAGLPEPSQPVTRPVPRHSSTARLIQSWIDNGDEKEQRETFEALREGLNASHSSYRKCWT